MEVAINGTLFIWCCPVACGILVPQPGMEPIPLAMEAWSPNHLTTREFPQGDLSFINNVLISKRMDSCISYKINFFKDINRGTSLVVQWLIFHAPNASGGPALIPGQGTRSHMLQLRPDTVKKKKKKKERKEIKFEKFLPFPFHEIVWRTELYVNV